ncbi:peptidase [Acinetobacter baylyi]|uniref:peptidase n=1 Tax=Acinetobacter baylyi TaxID=202950 RepID=UPI000EA08C22|nr:peptidase [Acinetobacter baylyi]
MGLNIIENNLDKIITNNKNDSLAKLKLRTRLLTLGEIELCRLVYKNSIDYSRVTIIEGSFFPLDLQNEDTFVTPNGHIFIPTKHFLLDYSTASLSYKHLFIHEMGHVWQHQRKNNVLINAGIAQACTIFKDPYKYNIHGADTVADYVKYKNTKKFVNYNLESQAEIFADYWALKTNNIHVISKKNISNIDKSNLDTTLAVYEEKISEVIK